MKKLLLSLLMVSLVFVFTSCDEDTLTPDPSTQTGSIALTSTPAGAQIWKAGVNTTKVTPDSLTALAAGTYSITLKLDGYYDTTFTVTVTGGKVESKAVTLTAMPLLIDTHSNLRLYEKNASGFSGIILSTGTRASSSGATTDLFYDGSSGKDSIYSQHLRLTTDTTNRYTDFFKGSATDLNDGIDATAYSGSSGLWKYTIPASVGNYYFIRDNNFHYAKFRVVAVGGGVPSDPDLWIEISFKYNKTAFDRRF